MAGNPNVRAPIPSENQPASGYQQDVVILSDFGDSSLEKRTRTSPAGRTGVRYTVTIKGDPVLNILSSVDLGRGPAQAIADLIQSQIRGIGQRAAEATILKRKYAANALARGAAWAVKRYTGGRIGTMGPGKTGGDGDRLFNDSGRLAEGIHVAQNPREGSWTVNVAANRLDPSTFKGGAFEAMVQRLVSLAPALGGGDAIATAPEFERAVANSPPVMLIRNATKWEIGRIYAGAVWRGGKAVLTAAGL